MKLIARKDGSSSSRRSRHFNTQPELDRAVERWRRQGFNVFWVYDHQGNEVKHWLDHNGHEVVLNGGEPTSFSELLKADSDLQAVHDKSGYMTLMAMDLVDMLHEENWEDHESCYREWKQRIGRGNFLAYAETLAAGRRRREAHR